MTKQELYRFTTQAYKRLKDSDFVFTLIKSKTLYGMCHFDKSQIDINPNGDILSTLVHELLHHINPEWSEKKVLGRENLIMNLLSHKQMSNLIIAFAEALKRTY